VKESILRFLFHNPLIRFAARMWWLPALMLVVVPFLPRVGPGFTWLLGGAAACLGLSAGVIGVPALQAWSNGRREGARHAAAKHRFLCPACLCLGGFQFSCGGCGQEVDPHIVHTDGSYVDRCPNCAEKVVINDHSAPKSLAAHCQACGANHARSVHHERAVRIIGTLTPGDFNTLTGEIAPPAADPRGIRWVRLDDGKALTYLLSLGDLLGSRQALPPEHAARHVTNLWLGDVEPLTLGHAIDSFLTLAELDDERLAAIGGDVRAEQLEPAAARLLSARFGSVKYGVTAQAFLPRPTTGGESDRSSEITGAQFPERSSLA
jgi:hypothetical protein